MNINSGTLNLVPSIILTPAALIALRRQVLQSTKPVSAGLLLGTENGNSRTINDIIPISSSTPQMSDLNPATSTLLRGYTETFSDVILGWFIYQPENTVNEAELAKAQRRVETACGESFVFLELSKTLAITAHTIYPIYMPLTTAEAVIPTICALADTRATTETERSPVAALYLDEVETAAKIDAPRKELVMADKEAIERTKSQIVAIVERLSN